ncbi:MAG TPA: TIR domain-containing protein [Caulobacteraceae bacterium]
MSDVFISYARSTAKGAQRVAEALRALGYGVWLDDELPAHRAYTDVIEERLKAAKAVVVIWSAEAAKSHWVRAEATAAMEARTLVQLRLDGVRPPMPFNQIQCADLNGWSGDLQSPGWRKVAASVGDLMDASAPDAAAATVHNAPPLSLPDRPSIAVLPFGDAEGAKEGDYFADGMVEEITTALARFPSLFVIASGSSLTYRQTARNLKAIAQELGVRYLLEGSVRRSGSRVRIAAQLVDAIEGAQIWAERFDGTLEDVFTLQDTVANAVAGQIEPNIQAAEIRRARARPTQDLGAYELYLRGIQLAQAYDRPSMLEAIGMFERAIERDPNYALALAWAACCHSRISALGWSEDADESSWVGLDLARRALRCNDEDPEVLTTVAEAIADLGGDLADADALIERALSRNPGASSAWLVSGWLKLYAGRPELALQHYDKALRLDPRSPYGPLVLIGKSFSLVALRRFEEAIPLLKEAVQLRPDQNGGAMALTVAYAHLGRLSEARAALDKVLPAAIVGILGVFRDPGLNAVMRSGLALAGADV